MARATRTINPLHFEDLEPHRFEDLVRQLAHAFRPWRSLEATGRLGRDQGVDIRGWEVAQPTAPDDSEDGDMPGQPDREWRFQVKRHKTLGPADLRTIVGEAVPADGPAPYGLIVAAACDVSADALAALREEALARGVVETQMWSNAHLEDALFRPENDSLLFAYFDISIATKRRAQVAELRSVLALKQKIRGVLEDKNEDHNRGLRQQIVVRDFEAPYGDFDEMRRHCQAQLRDYAPTWHVATLKEIHPLGVVIERFDYEGIVRADGQWDVREDTRWWAAGGWDFSQMFEGAEDPTSRQFWGGAEEGSDKKLVSELRLIPWRNIVEVDPAGDSLLPGPHLICRYDEDDGPYFGRHHFRADVGREDKWLRPEDRRPLFEPDPTALPARGERSRSTKSKDPRRARANDKLKSE
jgi:hypothetical protein